MINQPGHAKTVQFLVEELNTQLTSQQGHVLDDGQPDPPLGVLCQLHDGWEERLAQLLDANDLVDTIEVGDDVETNIWTLVLELGQEEW